MDNYGIYDEVCYQGKKLKDWVKELNWQFSCGEIYRMTKNGEDLNKFLMAQENSRQV